MSVISEEEWRTALTEILEMLDEQQLFLFLSQMPKHLKTKSREEMPQTIIEHYGVETSVLKINEIIRKIPPMDAGVQDRLKPFVDKLRNKQEAVKKDEVKSPNPDEERKMPPWRMSIQDLKIFSNFRKKGIAGKVVQKSGLRTYQTKNKKKRFFFYLGVADDSSSIKVMVYGREHFQRFQEKSFYLFRNVIMEEDVMKVTKKSIISKTASFTVPENLEMEARMLVYSQMPVCSIAKASVAPEKTSVSVEGRVTEIRSVETIKLKAKRGKKDKQEFDLEDSTGSIGVTLWGEHIKQLRGTSHGDVVRVTNVKTSRYYDAVSLNSTAFTRIFQIRPLEKITVMKQRKTKRQVFQLSDDSDSIQICVWGENTLQCKGLLVGEFIMVTNVKTHHFRGVVSLQTTGFTRILKVRSASIQKGRIEIKGISKANKTHTYLEAEFNQQLQTFVVASRLLAKAFGLQLDENFKQRLVDKVPISAVAQIQGNKIHTIKKTYLG